MIKKNSTSGNSSPVMEDGAVYCPTYNRQINHYYESSNETQSTFSHTSTIPNFALENVVTLNLGTETLAASRFLKKIERSNISLDEISISIDGHLTNDKSAIALRASPKSLIMDGYIRNFTINTNGKESSVGGSNATLEDIGAHNITIEMPAQLFDEISDGYSQIYLISKEKLSGTTLEVLHQARHFESAISAARFTKTAVGLTMLTEYLKGLKNPYLLSLVAEGFRNFENIYSSNNDLTATAVQGLDEFIFQNKQTEELEEAVVFATESLGYIFRSSPTFNSNVSDILSKILCADDIVDTHKHLPWAASVAMDFEFEKLNLKNREKILELLQADPFTKKLIQPTR